MTENVWTRGVCMTQFGVHVDRFVKPFTKDSVRAALSDASAGAVGLEVTFFANATQSGTDQRHARAGRRQVHNPKIALAENSGAFHRDEEAVAAVAILGGP